MRNEAEMSEHGTKKSFVEYVKTVDNKGRNCVAVDKAINFNRANEEIKTFKRFKPATQQSISVAIWVLSGCFTPSYTLDRSSHTCKHAMCNL